MRWCPRWSTTVLVLMFCGALLGQAAPVAAGFDSGVTEDVLVDDNALLLEVHVHGERLSDTLIVGYEGPAGILLPVGKIGDLLGYAYEEDVYVYSRELEELYGIDAVVDVGAAVLEIHADAPIPLVQRMQRQRNWQLLTSQRASRAGPAALHRVPYSVIDVGTLDISAAARTRKREGVDEEETTELEWRGAVAGELLFMTALLDFDIVEERGPRLSRFTLQRLEREPILLGPLAARQVMLWDIVHPGLPLVTSANVGRGLFLSNVPITRSAVFDTIRLQGPLEPGWDVELYRNDILIDFRRADDRGTYEFDDVVLYFGENDLRLVFYGPYGEVVTERYHYPVSDMLIPAGETYYQISGGRDRAGREQVVARFGLAVGPTTSVDVGAARVPVGDERTNFAVLGVQTLGPAWFAHAHAAGDADGGRALDVGVRTQWGDTFVAGQQVFLRDFESRRFPRRADPLVGRTTLALSGTLRTQRDARVPTGVELVRSQMLSGRETWRLSHRIGTFTRRTSVTNWLNWTTGSGAAYTEGTSSDGPSLTGQLLLSRRRERAGVMYSLRYRLHPDALIETFGIDVESPLPRGSRLRLGVSNAFDTSDMLMSVSVHRELGAVTVGVNASYDIRGEYRYGIDISAGAVRNSPGGGWRGTGAGATGGGAAAVTVFLDENANGVMDAGERPVEGVAVSVEQRQEATRTDTDGVLLLAGLPAHTPTTFEIDATTLPDIFWTPGAGVSIVPRPGKVAEVPLPVVIRGEVVGTTFLYESTTGTAPGFGQQEEGLRAVSGVQLELVQSDGNVVGRTVSGFGGFFVFTDVLPGAYVVRVVPEQAERLGLTTSDTVVVVDGGGSSHGGVDVVLIGVGE